jgi:hypothetical protein
MKVESRFRIRCASAGCRHAGPWARSPHAAVAAVIGLGWSHGRGASCPACVAQTWIGTESVWRSDERGRSDGVSDDR